MSSRLPSDEIHDNSDAEYHQNNSPRHGMPRREQSHRAQDSRDEDNDGSYLIP